MKRASEAVVVCVLGLAARIAWVLVGPDAVLTDAAAYRALAHAMSEGHGYASRAGPTAYWVPGWPAWMAMLYRAGASDRGVMLANVALGGATIAVVWALACETKDARGGRIAAAICALAPSLVLLPRVLLSENLALPLVGAATLALLRARRTERALDWALFGLAVAVATLVREASAAMLLAGVWFLFRARAPAAVRALAMAAMVGTFALVTAPWALRNREAMGATTLTTSAGVNLCIGLGDGATGGFRALEHIADPLDSNEVTRNREGLRCAESGLAHHPLELVTLAPAKLSRLALWDDWIVDDFIERASPEKTGLLTTLRVLCNVFWWGLCAAAITFGWRSRCDERTRRIASTIGAIVATVALSTLVTFGAGRFHTPLVPLLAALAGGCYRRAP